MADGAIALPKDGGVLLDGSVVTLTMLAGGKSRRFRGMDKQEWRYRGEPLGRVVAKNLLCSTLVARGRAGVMVVGGTGKLYGDLPLLLVADQFPDRGPLGGLHAALLSSRADWVYLVACDMPFFMDDWLEFLLCLAGEARGADSINRGVYNINRGADSGAARADSGARGAAGAASDGLIPGHAALDGTAAPLAIFAQRAGHSEPFHALYSRNLLPAIEEQLRQTAADSASLSLAKFLGSVPCCRIPAETVEKFTPDGRLFTNINTREEAEGFVAAQPDSSHDSGVGTCSGLRPRNTLFAGTRIINQFPHIIENNDI